MSTPPLAARPTPRPSGRDTLDRILALVDNDLAAVNRRIDERLKSDVALIRSLGTYIIAGGGKRLRPVALLLAARACGYRGGDHHITLAAVIEFIHTATLLHDDVVDASDLRRGQATANAVWGNEASILTGDFLYSRSFEMMVEVGSMQVMEILAATTNRIAEGEVLQLLSIHSPEVTEEQYRQTVERKTARLFEAAGRLAAVISGQPATVEEALGRYGLHMGIAFQMVDDLLDYDAEESATGKHLGDDLAEGKATLPLIHAMAHADPGRRNVVRRAIEKGDRAAIDRILDIIESTGSLEYTARRAREEADTAIASLATVPPGKYRDALGDLARFSVARTF
jgi:octaprenyl-diphosphate synthase